jgi:hypothetical protein
MKWLITIKEHTSKSRLRELLRPSGSTLVEDVPMVPMEDGDVVVEVEGPADLPQRIKAAPEVKAVHPSSEMVLY